MRSHVIFLFLLAFAVSAFSQEPGRQIVSSPEIQPPAESVQSGLGGRVNVKVSVNKAGEVTSVRDVLGPDWVCPSIERPDVLALRETAKALARKVKFAAAEKGSTEWIGIPFPTKSAEAKATAVDPASGEKPVPRIINGGVINGKAKVLPKPVYPVEARGAGASGPVQVRVLIDEDGNMFSAEPVSGHRLLFGAARGAACAAEFSQTRLMGRPVKVSGVITYFFVP